MSDHDTPAPAALPTLDDARDLLRVASERTQERFVENRSILSFTEYLALVDQAPQRYLRDSARYLRDAFDHFGTRVVETPLGPRLRYVLFDALSDTGNEHLAGQEEAQRAIYRLLGHFAHQGRVDRLILLHGPNGSAKTSIINGLIHGLEAYSRTGEGALYRFNWVFPSKVTAKGSIGFGGGIGELGGDADGSYAHLDGHALDARIRSDLKSNPLLLLPHTERQALFQRWRDEGKLPENFTIPRGLSEGEMDHKSREIFDALLGGAGGDLSRVLAHVQVERFYVSRRYRRAVVTVEPQMSVDASARQITADQSLAKLPATLSHVPLIEAVGDLVDANRGIIEYSDLLKRPLEAFKYLLSAVETQRVNVGPVMAFLDMVMIGTTNVEHLAAFKEAPDFPSFKGRIELVRVPYLLRVSEEQAIYDQKISRASTGKDISPHATWVAALWAVLTRMRRPQGGPFDQPEEKELRKIVESLKPLEKARLYDGGEAPKRLNTAEAQTLRNATPRIYAEAAARPIYEGIIGASAREMVSVLLAAAQDSDYDCLSPNAVFAQLEKLTADPSLHPFLRQEVVDGYHDNRGFIDVVRRAWLNRVLGELRSASGLVDEARYGELFDRYVRNVSAWLKGDTILDEVTQRSVPPDEATMARVEEVIAPEGEEPKEFRQALIGRIASRSLDQPGEVPKLDEVFPDYIDALKEDFYRRNRAQLRKLLQACLTLSQGSPEEEEALDANERRGAAEFLKRLESDYGYVGACATDAIVSLLRHKLSTEN